LAKFVGVTVGSFVPQKGPPYLPWPIHIGLVLFWAMSPKVARASIVMINLQEQMNGTGQNRMINEINGARSV
jgi:hypothetical protein